MLRSKDIALLNDFVVLCEVGNMTRAAKELNTTQSAVTQRMQRLESALNTSLMKRHSRGIEPTEQGKILLSYISRLNLLVDDAIAEIAAWEGSPVGAVSIGLPPSVSAVLTTPLIFAVKNSLPGVELTVAEAFSGYLEGWLETGEIDFAFVFNRTSTPQIEVTHLLCEELYLICNSELNSRLPDELEVKDLERIPLIAPSRRHGLRTEVQKEADKQGIDLNIVLEIDAGHQLIRQIELGLGAAILARSSVMPELTTGTLFNKRIVKPSFTRTVSLAVRRQKAESYLLKRVEEVLLKVVTELIQTDKWPADIYDQSIR
ncbi:LysR family transcriptional regulator [Marinomonas sp.]|uniref:LysR family transcriptional regulator n=1 Tax=Marinomonas sp. TaxID=1904862 RepID=UPI003A9130E2